MKTVGTHSDAMYIAMRKNIQNALGSIERSHSSSSDEIRRAKAAAAVKIKAIDDQQYGQQTSLIEGMKKNWLAASVAIYAVMRGIQAAWGLMGDAAKFEQQKVAFDKLAASYGASGDKIIADLNRISGGTIDAMTAVEKAGTAMMMGIAPDKISKLMEIARATAKMTGQSVVKSFEDISLAVGRQSKMILDNLGIIVSAGKANEDYAATLGKTALQLTDTEKKTAFLNATITAGEDLMSRMGDQGETAADSMAVLEAIMKDVRLEIGKMVLRLMDDMLPALRWTAEAIKTATKSWAEFLDGVTSEDILKEQLEEINKEIKTLKKNLALGPSVIEFLYGSEDEARKQLALFEKQAEIVTKSIKTHWNVRTAAGVKSAKDQVVTAQGLTEKQKKELEKRLKAEKDAQREIIAFHTNAERDAIWRYKEYEADIVAAAIAANEAIEEDELDLEQLYVDSLGRREIGFGLFIEGIKQGYGDLIKIETDWKVEGERLFWEFTRNTSKAFSDSFVAVIKGDFDSIGDAWDAFLDSMIRAFADMLADMLVKWAISGLGSILSGAFGGGGGGGGFVPDWVPIIGWLAHGTGAGGVPQSGAYVLHTGEIVLTKKQSDVVRASSGFSVAGAVGSDTPGGGGSIDIGSNLTGHKGSAPYRSYEDPIWTGPGFEEFLEPKDFLTKGIVGAFVDATAEAFSFGLQRDLGIRGAWAEAGAVIGKVILGAIGLIAGGPVMGAMGAVIGSGIGTVLGDLLGDAFNMRETEPLRDYLEREFGFFGGRHGFADDFYDKIGTLSDPFGANTMAGSFTAQYGNFIDKNKETFEELGIDVNQSMVDVAKDIARAAGWSEAEIEGSIRDTTTSIESDITAFSTMTKDMAENLGINFAGMETAFDAVGFDFGIFTSAAIDAIDTMITATTDLETSIKEKMDAAIGVIDTAIGNANDAADAANNAGPGPQAGGGGNDYDPGEEGDDWGDGGNQGGSGDAGGGGGESDPGDTEGTGWQFGGRVPRTGPGFLHAGEEVITQTNVRRLERAFGSTGAPSVVGRPMKIVLQIGRDEWAANVNAIRDVERVKLAKRPVGTRRISY